METDQQDTKKVYTSHPEAGSLRTEEVEEISLKDLILKVRHWFKYLLSKWVIILVFGILGGILGVIYAMSQKAVYTAETTFVLEEGNAGGGMLGQLGGLASLAGIDAGGGSGGLFQGENIIQLYKSRSMVEKTLLSEVIYEGKRQLMIDRYLEFNNIRESWSKTEFLKDLNFNFRKDGKYNRTQDSILGITVNAINTNHLMISKLDKKSGIIKVQVKAQDEFFAKAFNDQIVQNVNDFYIQTKTKKALENLAILQHQTDSVRNVLNGAIYQTAAVTDATPNLNPTKQVLRAPVQKLQFNAEANKAILGQLVQNLELAKLSLRKETPLIQVVDHPVYPLEKAKFGKLKGLILGGFIFGFATVVLIIIRKIYTQILDGE